MAANSGLTGIPDAKMPLIGISATEKGTPQKPPGPSPVLLAGGVGG